MGRDRPLTATARVPLPKPGAWYYGPSRTVDARACARFAEATGDPAAIARAQAEAPPLLAFLLLDDPLRATLGGFVTPSSPVVLHRRHHLHGHRLLRPGDVVVPRLRADHLAGTSRTTQVALTGELLDESGAVVSTQTMEFVVPGRGHPAPEPRMVPSRDGSGVGNLACGEPALVRDVFLPVELAQRYAAVSGDDQFIHVDEAAARQAGLGGTVVQGICLLAVATAVVAEAGPDLRVVRTAATFSRPVPTGEAVRVVAWEDPDQAVPGARFGFRLLGASGRAALKGGLVELEPRSG